MLLLLQLVGVDHHGNRSIVVDIVLRLRQADQGLLGLIKLICTDEVPWGLWGIESSDGKRDGPDPLDSKGNSVTPLGCVIDETLEHTGRNELSDAPAEVDVGGKVSTNGERSHLGGVGGTSRGKDTPWDTAQKLTDKHNLDARGEEDDEDKAREPEETNNEDLAVTPFGGGPTVHEGTDDVGEGTKTVEALLPRRRDLISVFVVEPLAILIAKARVPIETTYKGNVISLHDHGRGDH